MFNKCDDRPELILALGGALILDEAAFARQSVGLLAEFCNLVGTPPALAASILIGLPSMAGMSFLVLLIVFFV